MSPERKYGSPQLAYETYGPRSTTLISAVSLSRRARAAAVAPAATPPTTRIRFLAPIPASRSGRGMRPCTSEPGTARRIRGDVPSAVHDHGTELHAHAAEELHL